jgi:integrase
MLSITPRAEVRIKPVCATPKAARVLSSDSEWMTGYRHGVLPGNKHENPVAPSRCPESSAYEAVVVTPEQMIVMLNELDTPKTQMEWMIALLHAATALRPEEAFGLQWQDVDWQAGRINIQRAWSKGEPTAGKNRGSMTQVVMSPVLA